MLKLDLVRGLLKAFPGVTKQDMTAVVDTLFDCMSEALTQGQAVEIRGIGRFKVKQRGARQGRNPKTEMSIDIPTRWTVHFRPGEDLSRLTNS